MFQVWDLQGNRRKGTEGADACECPCIYESHPSGHQVQASSSLRFTGSLHSPAHSLANPHAGLATQSKKVALCSFSSDVTRTQVRRFCGCTPSLVLWSWGSEHKFQHGLSKWRAFSGELGFLSSSLVKATKRSPLCCQIGPVTFPGHLPLQ